MFQLDQLRTLVAVADEGTFEAAAARLHITASAVSQRIKAMEHAAGQVLVQRSNPARPTAAGDIALRYARQMQLLEADASQQLRGMGLSTADTVSIPIGVSADALATWFLAALADLPHLGAVFDIHREDQEYTTTLLRSGTVMAAVTSTAEPVQGCTSEPLGIMRYRAVCSPRFADEWLRGASGAGGVGGASGTSGARSAMADGALDDAPVICFDRKDDLQHKFFRAATGRALHAPRHYVPTSADFARAIVLGLGWGLLPEQQCAAELASGALIEFAPEQVVDVRLYWQRWNLPSPLLDRVSGAVRDAAAASLHAL
jgi:LysR family transcriptional regulator (chromosome initiation inhibitor)